MRLPSLRSLLVTAAFALPLAAAAPAVAAPPLVGIGDQNAAMFSDPQYKKLDVAITRYTLPWNWYKDPYQEMLIDQWIAAAKGAGQRPLIAFNRHWGPKGDRQLPSRATYVKSFRTFRERYPEVKEFSAWNEANHSAQPTARKPRAAANYYRWMAAECRTCTIVAADVLDSTDMTRWITTFKRYAPKARLWGLHNYKDANNGTTHNTRALLKLVKGKVWMTETGGIKRLKPHPGSRGNGRTSSLKGQALAIKRVFKLARMSKRIKRIYFYEWAHKPIQRWDSAFVDRRGKPRPALATLRAQLRALR
jgi:hypothetical protein